ncbi:MAG TPA: PAS domain-containing protein [Candidatus Saccharimonadales bacterium]|nr:PAS domain-containing protein [Candidatus Saccharimonadales bacterium]
MAEGEIDAPSGVRSEAAKAGIMYELDLSTGALKWNDTLYAVMHYPRSEPVGQVDWWVNHIHPEDAMILNQAMDKLDDASIPNWVVAYRFRDGNGSYVYVRDRASIVRDASGSAVSLIGTLTPLPDPMRGIIG